MCTFCKFLDIIKIKVKNNKSSNSWKGGDKKMKQRYMNEKEKRQMRMKRKAKAKTAKQAKRQNRRN